MSIFGGHGLEWHADRLASALEGSRLRWATAESCTGGQLAALMARNAALGSHLERGFVVYSIDAKCECLGVKREDALRYGAVNPEVASAMAVGARKRSHADLAIAITGFCGPQETDEEVGLVYLSCVNRQGRSIIQKHHFGDVGRGTVLDLAVGAALALMVESTHIEIVKT